MFLSAGHFLVNHFNALHFRALQEITASVLADLLGCISRITFRAVSVDGVSPSPFTYGEQIYVHDGGRWEADITLAPMQGALAMAWVGFLLALNGREGTFLMGDPAYVRRGAGTGAPQVKGASQFGRTLLTDGWTPNVTGILKAGDWFQLGTGGDARLHKLVQAADSDGGGNATLEIWPALRGAPNDNAAIYLSSPAGRWRLASNASEWTVQEALIYGLDFQIIEAL